MVSMYDKFINTDLLEGYNTIEHVTDTSLSNVNINKTIDNAYKHFKSISKPVNVIDIIEYVEDAIGKELTDKDYENLYYKITGDNLSSDEIMDADGEKFTIR